MHGEGRVIVTRFRFLVLGCFLFSCKSCARSHSIVHIWLLCPLYAFTWPRERWNVVHHIDVCMCEEEEGFIRCGILVFSRLSRLCNVA